MNVPLPRLGLLWLAIGCGGPGIAPASDGGNDAGGDATHPAGWGVACGGDVCMPDLPAICCVEPDGGTPACVAGVACAPAAFAVQCDGPEDCPPGIRCCAIPRLSPSELICRGDECAADEYRVCHGDADCRAGNFCCPATRFGLTYDVCLGYACP